MIIVRYIPPKHWYESANWELVEDYISPEGILVPSGFITDGASIPFIVRGLLLPTGKLFPAAIVHDYLLHIGCDWDMCNDAFERELNHINITKFKREIVLSAVRLYAYFDKKF